MNRGEQGSIQQGYIFPIVHSFLDIEEDVVSLRCIARKIVAITANGQVITLDATDQYKSAQLPTLIARIQRACKQSSDLRKLLGYGLIWLISDIYGLELIWEDMLHEDAEMFGYEGKANIIGSKKRLLADNKAKNYRIDSIHQIDGPNRVIVSDFDCLIEGKEGCGTEVMKFNRDWKVIRVDAIRH
jgi:hypothetical protein